jgi:heme ABC exporter ATP-binding subunit CcmA
MSGTGGNLLEARALSRRFGRTRALRKVDFDVQAGEVVAIIGPNGAGKSTLIRILATILRPDEGRCTLAGIDILRQPVKARALIGYLGHESMLDGALSMRENLRLFARIYGAATSRADKLVERFNAGAYADRPVAEYSRGQEQTAGLCRALLHAPALLLLDEPSTGLDEAAQKRLWQSARDHANAGAAVVFTTHDHEAAKAHADKVRAINAGQWQ